MPKASSSRSTDAESSKSHLKRNQACHQCRRKKLKCDAGRPCGTCMKSHAHAIAPLMVKGLSYNAHPTCTYDDSVDELPPPRQLQSSTRVIPSSRDSRNDSLSVSFLPSPFPIRDDLLRNARVDFLELGEPGPSSRNTLHTFPTTTAPEFSSFDFGATELVALSTPNAVLHSSTSLVFGNEASTSPRNRLPLATGSTDIFPPTPSASESSSPHSQPSSSTQLSPNMGDPTLNITSDSNDLGSAPSPPTQGNMDAMFFGHAPSLPEPSLLHHLIDIFFSCVPFSSHLIHRPTFFTALLLPPTSSSYPGTGLLHAMCALGALHSPVVARSPMPDLSARPAHQIFIDGNYVITEQGLASEQAGSFAIEQAALARAMSIYDARMGIRLKDAVRATIILGWYYYAQAQWVDAWQMANDALRFCVPLGLNVSSAFDSLKDDLDLIEPGGVLPPTQDPVEQEQRRNLFWLAYLLDRHQQTSTGWVGCIEEQDIGQELPGKLSDYEGQTIATGRRQYLSDPDVLTKHPPHLTDPFALHVKATILISRVTTFNRAAKLKRQNDILTGNAYVPFSRPRDKEFTTSNFMRESMVDKSIFLIPERDRARAIQELPAFKSLDTLILACKLSIPREYRDPFAMSQTPYSSNSSFKGGRGMSVDPVLFATHTLFSVATILLHSPVADINSSNDKSREKLLQATRSMLESVHNLMATSYDLALIPNHTVAYFTLAARTLTRFYMAALEAGNMDDAELMKNELNVMCLLLGRLGERLPVGYRAEKSIRDVIELVEQARGQPSPESMSEVTVNCGF